MGKKRTKNRYCFRARFWYDFLSILTPFEPPKPSPNPSKIDQKSIQIDVEKKMRKNDEKTLKKKPVFASEREARLFWRMRNHAKASAREHDKKQNKGNQRKSKEGKGKQEKAKENKWKPPKARTQVVTLACKTKSRDKDAREAKRLRARLTELASLATRARKTSKKHFQTTAKALQKHSKRAANKDDKHTKSSQKRQGAIKKYKKHPK